MWDPPPRASKGGPGFASQAPPLALARRCDLHKELTPPTAAHPVKSSLPLPAPFLGSQIPPLGSAQAQPGHRLRTGAGSSATWWAFKGRRGTAAGPGPRSPGSCKYVGSRGPELSPAILLSLTGPRRCLAGGASTPAFVQAFQLMDDFTPTS